MKKSLIYISLFLLLVAVALFYFYRETDTSVAEIFIRDIQRVPGEGQFVISGDLVSSAKSYRGYRFRSEGDTLILSIRSGLVTPFHKSGNFQIKIDIGQGEKEIKRIVIDSADKISQIYPNP